MAVGSSEDVDPADAIAEVIAGCRERLGDARPQAGLLISAMSCFDPSIIDAVHLAFPGVRIVGVTSGGEVSSEAGYRVDSMSLVLFASDEVQIGVGFARGLEADVDGTCEAAVTEALAAVTDEPRLCLVLTDAFATDPTALLDAVRQALPAGVDVVGGAAASGNLMRPRPTWQFSDGPVGEDGVGILLFAGPIAHSVSVGTGWRPIGTSGVVTATTFNQLTEIDGRPALAFVSRYLDSTGPSSYGNPLAIYEDGADEPYLRVALRSDPETGAITIGGSVPVGARVSLTTANTDDILGGVSSALARAAAAFPDGARPEAALLFSCTVRQFLLGSRTGKETELARAALGPTLPFAGLYCNGEIGPGGPGGDSRFLNETFVTLLLGT